MHRSAIFLLLTVAALFSMGLLMIFDTTAAEVLDRSLNKSTHFALVKQILYAICGAAVATLMFRIGHRAILARSQILLSVGILFLILVLIPGIGQQVKGARRWIYLFDNSLQPSEFMKILLPLYAIHYISTSKEISLRIFLRLIAIATLPLALILVEPDNGTVAILLVCFVVLFLLSRIKSTYWALPLFLLALCGIAAASQMPHARERLKIYLHPELDLQGKGHQPYQAKIAAGSGKLLGKGLAQSLQKLDYLPEARCDYIAAIYAEEFGFVGISILISFYMLIAYLGFRIAQRATDLAGLYLAGTMTFLITIQAFLNLGVVSGLLPSKGVNLPFFSQGGSSLLANAIALALLLSVARRETKFMDRQKST